VASQSAVLDGYITATGTTPVSNGSALDMFLLYPGVRTVTVTAADNLGNSGTAGQCTFEIKPTAAGLISSLDRAWGLGLIKGQGLFNSMRTKLDNAAAAAERGQCAVESNIMNALANEALGQSGKGVEKNFADRLAAWALYVSQAGDPACVNATPHQVAEQ
jgi:hypothetical protein